MPLMRLFFYICIPNNICCNACTMFANFYLKPKICIYFKVVSCH